MYIIPAPNLVGSLKKIIAAQTGFLYTALKRQNQQNISIYRPIIKVKEIIEQEAILWLLNCIITEVWF